MVCFCPTAPDLVQMAIPASADSNTPVGEDFDAHAAFIVYSAENKLDQVSKEKYRIKCAQKKCNRIKTNTLPKVRRKSQAEEAG